MRACTGTSSVRRLVAVLALCLLPTTLPAQRVASERAGFAPRVALVRLDTTTVDSVAPQRSRAGDAVVGGLIGTFVGGLGSAIYVQQANRSCRGDLCGLAAIAIPYVAGIGLVTGAIIGALWPTR